MGGSSFGKQFGKITTTIVDPFGINKTQFGKTVRKVIDPLNIMDPLNVLPGQGEKWGTLDKNYGGPLRGVVGGLLGGGGSSYTPMTKGLPSNTQYFQQQQQMLQNMQAQQRSKLANLNSQEPSYSTSSQTASQVPSTSTAAAPTTSTLAQSKISDTTAPSDLPMELSSKPKIATPKIAMANTFQMPNMSEIKFGGA